MYLCDLFESISSFDEIDENYYLWEGCGIFAYALWLAHGKPQNGRIGIISNRQGEKWSRSIPFEVTHAFFLIENNSDGIDVKGIRPLAEIADDFSNSYFHSQYHPDDFRTRFMGNSDSKPLYGVQIDIRAAIKIILAHPNLFSFVNHFENNRLPLSAVL